MHGCTQMDRLGPRVHVSGFTVPVLLLGLPDIQTCTMHASDDSTSSGDDMHDQRGVGQPDSADAAGFSGRDQHSLQLRWQSGHPGTHPLESASETELQRVLGRLGNAVLRGALTGMSLRGGLHLVRWPVPDRCHVPAICCEPTAGRTHTEAPLRLGVASARALHARKEAAQSSEAGPVGDAEREAPRHRPMVSISGQLCRRIRDI